MLSRFHFVLFFIVATLIVLIWIALVISEKEMATHSSILTWRISWTEAPEGLQSMGSQSQT